MWLKIDYHNGIPIYRQIVKKLIEVMGRGELKNASPIPSVREMAEKLSVNPNTVAKAYRELQQMGYIYSRPGIGMFVKLSREKIEILAINKLKYDLKTILESAIAHGISKEKCKETVREVIKEMENE